MIACFLRLILLIQLLIVTSCVYAQDTIYARKLIKQLCSKQFLGRGYVNNGVNKAAAFIEKEIKYIGLQKFNKSYVQTYTMSVNTFPGLMNVTVNKKLLMSGINYLIQPTATTLKASYSLVKTDSVTYQAFNKKQQAPVIIKLQKKLTYTVATETKSQTVIELLKDSSINELKNIEIKFKTKFISQFKTKNIVGFIKGNQHPDTFIVFTAHYDHLGAMGKNTFFAGANDNASGVSMLLNLANYYKTHTTKYSVAFIFFSGEEAGLLGSKYYSEHPLFALSQIKFLTNLDLLGTGSEGVMVVNATVFKNQFEKLNQINTTKNYLPLIKQRGKAANSDHYWFTEKGVPSFFIYTLGGIKAYHDVFDVETTLPLTKYNEVCKLLINFVSTF